ncbi:MAG: hypothetical protein ACKVTZ_01615 [Bacteroidia bacterium]
MTLTTNELYEKVQATKKFLNRQSVSMKLHSTDSTVLSAQEISLRLDMIHEAERIGLRHLDERVNRKLTKMMLKLEQLQAISLN